MAEIAETEKIQGKKRYKFFESLKKERLLFKLRVLETDYEGITLITGLKVQDGIPYVLMDYPKGFMEAVSSVEEWNVLCELSGQDGVRYTFRSSAKEIAGDEILVRFPGYIDRVQRRRHYRLEAPTGTKIYIKIENIKHQMNVVNISLGGALGVLVTVEKGKEKKPDLKMGQILKHVELFFPGDEEEDANVKVNMARVIRHEDTEKNRLRLAMEFTNIKYDEEKALNALVYRFQREWLRKRKRTLSNV